MNQNIHDFFVFKLDIMFNKILHFKQIFVDLLKIFIVMFAKKNIIIKYIYVT